MKSRFIKMAIVAASALAFMNCGDDAANSVSNAIGDNGIPGVEQPSEPIIDPITGEVIQPADPEAQLPADGPSEGQPVVQPGEGETVGPNVSGGEESVVPGGSDPSVPGEVVDPSLPTENPAVGPESSADVEAPASSSSVVPEVSSSSEKAPEPESSSSVEEPVQQAPKGIFLANDTDENKNYMEVEYFTKTGDNGGAVLAYPKRLSETQKHGVVLWGPGGGTEPTAYEGLIKRLASHGFVVIATSESPDGTGRGKPALDWLEKKNNTPGDPLYQKLDMTKVGASGHSMGGLQSEKMLLGDDRVITAVLNNSGAFDHATAAKVSKSKTIAIVYGEGGMERPNAEGDYYSVKAGMVPACLLKMTGGKGNECQNGECGWGHGSGPWGGMAATVAWMRWHLGGEDFRKKDFVGTSGAYINGPIVGESGNWKGQCINF
ncbi:MAG: alpha/beta hydrolase [Fibrobacter sp.]|nr:alpha/beta hydrolase [Fibrobacter sp.]